MVTMQSQPGSSPWRAAPAGATGTSGATRIDGATGTSGAAGWVIDALRDSGAVLGVDVGGSGTRAALLVDGVVTRLLDGAPFNYLLQAGGVEQLAAIVTSSGALAAGIGVPGIAREPAAARNFARAISTASGVPTRVHSDATVAWLGAFLGGPGIVVIAGTGSVAVGGPGIASGGGLDGLVRSGGYGYLLGDQGGGYWIGRRGLMAALAAAAGTGPVTRLSDAVREATGASLDELVVRVHREPRDRTILASLAPVVAACARGGADGDAVAGEIIAAAAAELAALAVALCRRLTVEADPAVALGELPVAGVGGVFGIPELWAEFQRHTGAVAPLAPPEVGAALLAVQGRAVQADGGQADSARVTDAGRSE